MNDDRERLLAQLCTDLIGPQHGEEEEIIAWPSDQYISGILYPANTGTKAEDNDASEAADADDGSPGGAVPMSMMRRPSVMGVSFAIEGAAPLIRIRAWAATYEPRVNAEDPERADSWQRRKANIDPPDVVSVREGLHKLSAGTYGCWWIRGLLHEGQWQVTVALENTSTPKPGRIHSEPVHLFQVGFEVETIGDARVVPRYSRKADTHDADSRIHNLIYRDAKEWAVGHTCGATWEIKYGRCVISSTWIPRQCVSAMSADGHPVFEEEATLRASELGSCFSAEALARAPDATVLAHILEALPVAYERWLREVEGRVATELASGALTADMASVARENIVVARDITRRIRRGITLVTSPSNADIRRAFQLAQEAMLTQRRWGEGKPGAKLTWRPFQLAFQLLALGGIAAPRTPDGALDPDRDVMDLLWFPTGGGKTEAYLGLTAFTLILRRLRRDDANQGAGVTVLMRYTLRLLTVQQFERAARLVMACELLRRDAVKRNDNTLGTIPFSIGLWVGSAATPNKVQDARRDPLERAKAKQLARCPACGGEKLIWDRDKKSPHFLVECSATACPLHGEHLPVYTIDEDVYALRPGLVIGTIDKFAQVVRQPGTHNLFDSPGGPPELIIQDELHLISGPLGTVAGLYESAIDLLCTHDGVRPKVVGSTATIRRASDQVRQLFDRDVIQFPPPVLDADDSCFAVVDRTAPGRLYAGVTTAGRSPKFVLQAACASLLQGASEDHVVSPPARNWYWTLVAYFNSLRELGGALVMMQDDVLDSMKNLAALHGTAERNVEEIIELTSRVPQADIPAQLVALEKPYDPAKTSKQEQHIGIVLATNMISVGVDIPRLGLMAVNGQPKTMSEYIQATSRVGRGIVPGLVVTVYNVGRPRDRSHYEAFRTWHQTIYRDVEATSVTPFAPRARDRALHAGLVALARHGVAGMIDDAELTPVRRAALDSLSDAVLARVERLDPSERAEVAGEIRLYLDEWEQRGAITHYWNDFTPEDSLLVSAEVVAEAKAVNGRWMAPARPTPNSMRDVEAQVQFRLTERLT